MGRLCLVSGCPNNKSKTFKRKTKVHSFPRNLALRKQWIRIIGRENDVKHHEINPKYYGVCERHFTNDQFEISI